MVTHITIRVWSEISFKACFCLPKLSAGDEAGYGTDDQYVNRGANYSNVWAGWQPMAALLDNLTGQKLKNICTYQSEHVWPIF